MTSDKKRNSNETTEEWLIRIGFKPLTDEQKRRNLESNLDFFLKNSNKQWPYQAHHQR